MQGKVKARLRKGQCKVKAKPRQGQSQVKERERLRQHKHSLNHNYNIMGFDTIEINLVNTLFLVSHCFPPSSMI